jgi:hypothetical protein
MGDVWHRGLLTETHAIRVAELQAVAGAPLANDIGRLIQMSSKRGTEGVLVSVHQGTVTSQALRIDGRSGALKAVGRPIMSTDSKAQRAPAAAGKLGTAVASIPLPALKLYGNTAVFTTLPPSTLGRSGEEVKIGLSGPGHFGKVPPAGADAVPTITLPPALKDRATLHRYSEAFKEYQDVVFPPADALVIVEPVDFATAANAAQARSRVDADRTVPARLASSLSLGAPDVFLPGVGVLPNDFIMAVKTNPRFVEALMIGANHEMGREMLWQGLPTDQRGTPFQRFWQRLDGKEDIDFIHKWNALPLGTQPGSTEMLVLLIRGQLIERFPNLSIYAYKIVAQENRPGGASPPHANDTSEMDPNKAIVPVMRGHLLRDITYIGFPIPPGDIAKYFFIVEEHMTEPRFGFDERVGAGQNSNSWQDVDWDDIQVANGSYFGLTALKRGQPATGPRWVDPHAATVADAALQRPFRGYWRGEALKTPGD